MKKRAQKKRTTKRGILLSSAFGLCGAILILLTLLAIFSLVGLAADNPHSLLLPFSLFSIYAAAFFGGFIAIKKNKGRDALPCGVLCGVVVAISYSLIFGIIGIILDIESTSISWLYRPLMIPVSTLGSIVGIAETRKRPKRKRRR